MDDDAAPGLAGGPCDVAAPRAGRAPWGAIVLLSLASAGLRWGLAVRWPSLARPDEVFQNLEPAYRLWTGTGVVTWEWREGIRSWLFPGFLSGLMRLVDVFGWPHAWAEPVVWAALSSVSGVMVGLAALIGWRRRGVLGAVLCGVLAATWPDLVFYGPKPLGEVQAGQLLTIAAGLTVLGGRARPVLVGVLLGLAFDLRFQLAPACAVVAVWAGWRGGRLRLLAAALVPVLAAGVLDWVSWGTPFQSVWKNLWVNVVQGKAAGYGLAPADWYGLALVQQFGAALVPLGFGAWRGARDAPLLAAVALTVLLSHSLIGHKEYSFVFAALPAFLILAGLGLAALASGLRPVGGRLSRPRLVGMAAAATLATTAAVGLARATGGGGEVPHGLAAAWQVVASRPDVCGVGLLGDPPPWQLTPGYAGLQRRVPIDLVWGRAALAAAEPGFNYLVAPGADQPALTEWETVSCASGWCVLRRAGACTPVPADEINASLARRGL